MVLDRRVELGGLDRDCRSVSSVQACVDACNERESQHGCCASFCRNHGCEANVQVLAGGGRTIAIARYTQSERCKLGADDGGVGIDRESKRRCVWRSTNRAGYIRNTSRARNRESSIRGCLKCVLSTRRQPNPNSRVFYLVVTIYRHRTENFLCNSVQVHVYA